MAKAALVDSLVKDALAPIGAFPEPPAEPEAAEPRAQGCWPWWLAKMSNRPTTGPGGWLKVFTDRVVTVVDPEARHMHKSRSEYHDGYKAHITVEARDRLFTAIALTPAKPPTRQWVSSCWPASALAYKSSLTGPTAQAKPWLPWPKPATAGL